MTFWSNLEFAIQKAYEDGKYLPNPENQELIVWHDVQYGKKNSMLIQFRAQWLRSVDTIVYDVLQKEQK